MHGDHFTHIREPAVERALAAWVEQVGDLVFSAVPASQRRALLLIGGYGRGEGGVERTPAGPRPHNNLDFLLITKDIEPAEQDLLCHQVNLLLAPLRERLGIGIDFGAIAEAKLLEQPSLVMWYDMRFGHKVVLGDDDLGGLLARFSAEKIPAWNVRDLLVNRGTLLVINRWLHDHRDDPRLRLSTSERLRITLRHLIKAIIGYGDALLYFDGAYHWSYVEKLHRMRQCTLADSDFARLYSVAMSFRFEPDYELLRRRDVMRWQEDVLPLLSHVHLCCESHRLGRVQSDWSTYPSAAARECLLGDWVSPREWARKTLHCARLALRPMPQRGLDGWGLRAAGPRGRLSLAFPGVLYGDPRLREWSAGLLAADAEAVRVACGERPSPDEAELVSAYLAAWRRTGDVNFTNFVDRTGLTLPGLDADAQANAAPASVAVHSATSDRRLQEATP